MGLDVSHGCWDGPYSAFSRWRDALCVAAGWHLEEVREPDGFKYQWPREVSDAGLTDENYEGVWETIPEDPLVVLIAHSDCEGAIPVEALVPLADRLEELLPLMPSTVHPNAGDPPVQRAIYDGEAAATAGFIAGLRLAASRGEPVEFY